MPSSTRSTTSARAEAPAGSPAERAQSVDGDEPGACILRSSYCCLAHGTVLLERFDEPLLEIALDHRAAGLDEVDVAVMDLAERVVDDATSIDDADLQRLRELGLSETEIMDVVLAAAARCFFSKTLDSLGVLPDASYRRLAPELRDALVVGRPIADA
jgi:hypothetical protein